jgi:hypothetical protein
MINRRRSVNSEFRIQDSGFRIQELQELQEEGLLEL